jgi:ribosomal protein L11 methyltransferase
MPLKDPATAAAATRAAAAANGVTLASVERRDLRREAPPHAPTVVANLVRPLLLELAARMGSGLPVPERLLASGLEAGEAGEAVGAFAAVGLELAARRDGDGWSAILLRR